MEVILLEKIEKLGRMGDVVQVKPGFARNYLLPREKALRATEANKKVFEARRAELEEANQKNLEQAQEIALKIEGREVIIVRAAGDTGQLYGSVTARNIIEEIKNSFDVSLTPAQVLMARPAKTIGIFAQKVTLHPELTPTIEVNIAISAEQARQQRNLLARQEQDGDKAPKKSAKKDGKGKKAKAPDSSKSPDSPKPEKAEEADKADKNADAQAPDTESKEAADQ